MLLATVVVVIAFVVNINIMTISRRHSETSYLCLSFFLLSAERSMPSALRPQMGPMRNSTSLKV